MDLDPDTFGTVFTAFLIVDAVVMIGIVTFVVRLYRKQLAARKAASAQS